MLGFSGIVRNALIAGFFAFGGASAFAEAAPTAPKPSSTPLPPVSSEPQDTTASYGDWLLHCARADNGAGPKLCEVRQTLQVKGQGVIAEVAVSRASAKAPWSLTILLPTNISLPSAVRIASDDKDESAAEIQWRKCLPGGCVAEGELREEILRYWRAQSAAGQIRYTLGTGQPVALSLSFRGFAVALDNLVKPAAAQ
jgi:invasion protein IalB